MGRIQPKYSDEQREAVAHAYNDRNIRPAAAVVALAASGELTWKGERLAPFTIGESYVRETARRQMKRRAGKRMGPTVADAEPRDAVETLRRRLVIATEGELDAIELAQRRGKPVAGDDLRQLARAIREIAAIPGPTDPRPTTAPGKGATSRKKGGESPTTTGVAGAILRDMEGDTSRRSTAPPPSTHPPSTGDTRTTDGTPHTTEQQDTGTAGLAGLRVSGAPDGVAASGDAGFGRDAGV